MFKSTDQFISKDYNYVIEASSKKLAELKEKFALSKKAKLAEKLASLSEEEATIVIAAAVAIREAAVVEAAVVEAAAVVVE